MVGYFFLKAIYINEIFVSLQGKWSSYVSMHSYTYLSLFFKLILWFSLCQFIFIVSYSYSRFLSWYDYQFIFTYTISDIHCFISFRLQLWRKWIKEQAGASARQVISDLGFDNSELLCWKLINLMNFLEGASAEMKETLLLQYLVSVSLVVWSTKILDWIMSRHG